MTSKYERIKHLSDEDKLWELYLHTLAGWHSNVGANDKGDDTIAKDALYAAKQALKV